MAQQIIDTTTPQPNGKIGDTAKVAFGKVNDNFTELFGSLDDVNDSLNDLSGSLNALDTRVTANEGAIDALGALAAQAAPPGLIAYFATETPPTGWLRANGALVSRTTYAALFAAIGTRFGAGDGSTTFSLPDLRGEFVRSWDDGRGVDPGRALGSTQAGAIQSHSHLAPTGGGSEPLSYEVPAPGVLYGYDYGNAAPTTDTGDTETRPRNIALLGCIKF